MRASDICDKKKAPQIPEHPPVAEHFFRRPGVEHMLQKAFKRPLTTVIAGAGYGKTQAVLAALSGLKCNAVWMQLSELDNHAVRFWDRIADAFGLWSHNLHDSLISLEYQVTIAVFDQFLRLLTSELAGKDPFVLVLDDFHLISNKSILDFIELFISARVKNFSIVLISRTKPDISLSGMLSRGLLARITEEDLRFSKDEMNDYLREQGVKLNERSIKDIYSYTDGWIFAIYLVGLAAQKGQKKNPFLSAKIDIFDLIEKEIFAATSKELQEFLPKISIFDNIPSGLMEVLADHDLSLISETVQLNTFIRYEASSDNYIVHQLFREFLRGRKCCLADSDILETHLAAAQWYSGINNTFEAAYHYKAAGCYNELFDILISIPGRIHHGDADTLIGIIEQAPEDKVRDYPLIRIAKAGFLFNNNRLDEARLELLRMREEFEAQEEKNTAVLGEVYLWLAVICMVTSDYEFEELFKKADECLPDGSRLLDQRTSLADGVNSCSIKNHSAGELKRYQDALFRAAPHAARAMNGCGYGIEYLNAAESSLYKGNLNAAEKFAYEAIYRSRQHMQYDIEYMANFVLVRIYTAKGNYGKTNGILSQMKTQLETLQRTECISLYDIISGWFYMKLGKTDQVPKWIRHEEETRKMFAPVVVGREYLVRSDCLLIEERYYELLAVMEQTDKIYEARGILFAQIQNKITRAIVHHFMGNQEDSIRFLNEAYELSNPNQLTMQYIEYGNKMRTLINSARRNNNCVIPRDFLDKIYTKSSSYAKMLSQLVSAYNTANKADDRNPISLSKRESEALAYLNRGMTRKEMAASCYVSLSTVNSMLKSLYDKLGAANAAQAVRIAQERDLV